MTCPSEFEYSVYVDGELPEERAQAIHLHLNTCDACTRLVVGLRSENRLLVDCFQEVDLQETSEIPDFAEAAEPVSFMKFALGIIGAALAYKVATGLLFGFQLPEELGWVDPKSWLSNLDWALNALAYMVDNVDMILTDTIPTLVGVLFGGAVLFALGRAVSRSAATSSVFGALIVITLFSSRGNALDIRKGSAASVPAGERLDDSLIAAADGVHKNIDIAGTITGDLFVIGDLITISGTVEGNVVAIGRRVEISGTVGGTVLGGAQTMTITGRVGRNLLGAGGNINLGKTAEISSNAITAGSEVVVEGTTKRDLGFFGGVMDMRGNVGRNMYLRAGQASLSNSTHIGGNLTAVSDKVEKIQIASGAVIEGAKDIHAAPRSPARNPYSTARFYVWQIVRVLGAFVAGLLLFRFIPTLIPAGITSGKQWLTAGGLGFLFLVSVPIAAIIVGITIIGLPVALISLALWFAGLYFSKIVVAEFVGRSLMKERGAVSLLAGLFVVIVAVNLPWIGGLINFLLMLMGLGAIVMLVYRSRRAPVLASL
jgi:hypothetical protein